MRFVVESDVPLPDAEHNGGGGGTPEGRYPWPEMNPGDSFFVPEGDALPHAPQTAGRRWCERNRPPCTVVRRAWAGGFRYWMISKKGAP